MKQISVNGLSKLIESIVLANPLSLDELRKELHKLLNNKLNDAILKTTLDVLSSEKYTPDFYGFYFSFHPERIAFIPRTFQDIAQDDAIDLS